MITLDDFTEDIQQKRTNKTHITRSLSKLSSLSIDSNNSRYLVSEQYLLIKPKNKRKHMSCFASQLLTSLMPSLPVMTKTSKSTQNTKEREGNCIGRLSKSLSKKPSIKSKSTNCSSSTNSNSIPRNNEKYYPKKCQNISHFQTVNKFISGFLAPENSFISTDFNLRIEEYKVIVNKMNINKPPKIPHGHLKQLPCITKSCSKKALCL